MSIVSVHSYRGGTGKSNTTANLAALLAAEGRRVGVIDTDIQSPGIHVLFDIVGDDVHASLNDFLWHGRPISEVAQAEITETDFFRDLRARAADLRSVVRDEPADRG
jgi:MinD-like ATPase involved in chromosome partitioning or flagellar assembly